MLVQIRFGLEGESARFAWIRSLICVCPDVLLKDTWLGARQLAVGACMTALPSFGGGFGPLGFRGNLDLVTGFLRWLLTVPVDVFPLGRLDGDDVVRRGLLSGFDDLRGDFGRRHLLELLVQVLWLAIVVIVIIVVVVIVVVSQLWVCHRHSVGLCKEHGTFNHFCLLELGGKKWEEKTRSHHARRSGGGLSGDSENKRRRPRLQGGESES